MSRPAAEQSSKAMENVVLALFLFLMVATVGLGLWEPRRWGKKRAGLVSGTGRPAPPGARCESVLTIAPPPRAFWDERGWHCVRQDGCLLYTGEYRIRDRRTRQVQRFPGCVRVRGPQVETYIASPPAAVRHHPKGPCFQYLDGSWFRLHWHHAPRSADEAILYVERILDEAVNGTGRDL